MIAGEEGLFFLECKAHMVGGVPWGVHALNRPAIAFNHLAILNQMIWHKVHITTFFNRRARGDFTGAMRAITIGGCLPELFERGRSRRMIHMGVGN